MEGGVEMELERRSKFLNSLIQQKKKAKEQQDLKEEFNVRVRASDMPLPVQNRAFGLSREILNATPGKADNKRLALALKKDFDSEYGPAWHCIVGTSFGSYVTHSIGGFIYFQIDKVYVLLFKTAVEPLDHQ
ncbi:Dynein light chain [Hirschfeldia incana]|nr:Dynein light chain [Hirschfeldia incana]